ncbi:hypothetical protein KAFR_0C04480 [Kazachstania africana CBS 2517]|uniref:calcium/calmodulin-dependent protein kinase n=1 Tax=Kazachstania africana (strain ATCC 22294 / BCRC 22015 / CBS 2517 / CECT 1963 / NBRC 1671 / NRRL Y-8276) TaxID=1071382 RepID=H2AST9_KAZAF|nr:hypothetical protein KAFR_0C04480 [Kazachstania africana CBS 2517]CCF57439.1 hypothetical protein KAFR_0C04480 [Kazachstania africana CBS 2517]
MSYKSTSVSIAKVEGSIEGLAGKVASNAKTDYIFGKTLGAGTFGVVRQARKLSTNEDVAVKILLKKALEGNSVQLQMLYDELSILQRLNHPNIVEFKDWFETKEKFFIVTQLATGGELFDRIVKKGKFTEEDAIKILVQILGAVEYIHSRNIVHRDLKPENLLYIDEADTSPLVLADFGIAKELKSGDELIFKAAGSLGYVAPEVLTSDGHGKPCDIWSIGVITYTLLCGYSAFAAESVEGFLDECTQNDKPVVFHKPYWDNVSEDARKFILRALTLDPTKRPTATALLEDPWILGRNVQKNDLLPALKKGFDARKKFREAVELVKLNNRIQKLRQLYSLGEEESDSDIEENSVNSVNPSLGVLTNALHNLSISPSHTGKSPELTAEQKKMKSHLTQDAFAQIVMAATKNRHKVMSYQDSESEVSAVSLNSSPSR